MKIAQTAALGVLLTAVSGAYANNDLVISLDVDMGPPGLLLAFGDVVTLSLTADGTAPAGLCTLNLTLTCDTDDIQIQSVSLNPAFSVVLEESGDVLPGCNYHVVCAQPLSALDRTLGSTGEPVELGTIEVQVAALDAFSSGLLLEINGNTIGRRTGRTVIAGPDGGPPGPSMLTLPIGNQPGGSGGIVEWIPPWDVTYADVTPTVRRVGHNNPVMNLRTSTTYELHYDATATDLTGYVLFSIGTASLTSLTDAVPAPAGDWSVTGNFLSIDMDALAGEPVPAFGYPDGYFKYHMATDDKFPDVDLPAASSGHLCNFTTGEAGELNLELYMYAEDFVDESSVEMVAQAQFTVINAPGGSLGE